MSNASVALGLASKKIAEFNVVTNKVASDVDLANKATWVYQVSDGQGEVVKEGNLLACLYYKYKYGGMVSQLSNGQQSITGDELIKQVSDKIKNSSYVTNYDYNSYFNKEQKVLEELNMGKVRKKQLNSKPLKECFVFINRSAKTLKESIITEADDILAALDAVQNKSVTGVQDAYNSLVDLDVLPTNSVVLVVDDDSIESVGDALDAWVDDKLSTHQIEPDMFMANRGATHEFYPDYSEVIDQPNNAVALGVEDPIPNDSLDIEALVAELLGEGDDLDDVEDALEGMGDGDVGGEDDFEESLSTNPALQNLQHGSMRETSRKKTLATKK